MPETWWIFLHPFNKCKSWERFQTEGYFYDKTVKLLTDQLFDVGPLWKPGDISDACSSAGQLLSVRFSLWPSMYKETQLHSLKCGVLFGCRTFRDNLFWASTDYIPKCNCNRSLGLEVSGICCLLWGNNWHQLQESWHCLCLQNGVENATDVGKKSHINNRLFTPLFGFFLALQSALFLL